MTAPDPSSSIVAPVLPFGACDCHMHVFGPPSRYPGAPERSYDPREKPLAEYEALASSLGFERVVFVQPSGYGLDNRCQLEALESRPETSRAVVVIDDSVEQAELERMDRLGVRGARLNLMTPRLTDGDAVRRRLEAAAARIAPLGWHLQIYTDLAMILAAAPALRDLSVPVVFDHMGGASEAKGTAEPGFAELLELLAAGKVWVKLSGADIVTWENENFCGATQFALPLIEANAAQVVWGSDWPHLVHHHSGVGDDAPPAGFRPVNEAALLAFLRRWAGSEETFRRILVDNPERLYRF